LTVYISEAHPDDEWQMESNRKDEFVFKQPRTIEDRLELARLLPKRLKLRMPIAVDPMDGRADKAFAAWPERIYVLAPGGRVIYRAAPGPFGFKPEEAEESLSRFLGESPEL
jgi:hypothetical protein